MNTGLTQGDVMFAWKTGWTEPRIYELHNFMVLFGLIRTGAFGGNLLLGYTACEGRVPEDIYVAYQDRPIDDLQDIATKTRINGTTIIYCDGSGTTKENIAGIGVVVREPGREQRLIAENIGPGTNNRAELTAIMRGLKAIPDVRRKIEIRSDSQYALGACFRDNSMNVNYETIAAIRMDLGLRGGNVTYKHVPGHDDEEGNELADRLAGWGRKYGAKVPL